MNGGEFGKCYTSGDAVSNLAPIEEMPDPL